MVLKSQGTVDLLRELLRKEQLLRKNCAVTAPADNVPETDSLRGWLFLYPRKTEYHTKHR